MSAAAGSLTLLTEEQRTLTLSYAPAEMPRIEWSGPSYAGEMVAVGTIALRQRRGRAGYVDANLTVSGTVLRADGTPGVRMAEAHARLDRFGGPGLHPHDEWLRPLLEAAQARVAEAFGEEA